MVLWLLVPLSFWATFYSMENTWEISTKDKSVSQKWVLCSCSVRRFLRNVSNVALVRANSHLVTTSFEVADHMGWCFESDTQKGPNWLVLDQSATNHLPIWANTKGPHFPLEWATMQEAIFRSHVLHREHGFSAQGEEGRVVLSRSTNSLFDAEQCCLLLIHSVRFCSQCCYCHLCRTLPTAAVTQCWHWGVSYTFKPIL